MFDHRPSRGSWEGFGIGFSNWPGSLDWTTAATACEHHQFAPHSLPFDAAAETSPYSAASHIGQRSCPVLYRWCEFLGGMCGCRCGPYLPGMPHTRPGLPLTILEHGPQLLEEQRYHIIGGVGSGENVMSTHRPSAPLALEWPLLPFCCCKRNQWKWISCTWLDAF